LKEEKVGYGGKDLQKRKLLSLEWMSEGVMDDESGELMELIEVQCVGERPVFGGGSARRVNTTSHLLH